MTFKITARERQMILRSRRQKIHAVVSPTVKKYINEITRSAERMQMVKEDDVRGNSGIMVFFDTQETYSRELIEDLVSESNLLSEALSLSLKWELTGGANRGEALRLYVSSDDISVTFTVGRNLNSIAVTVQDGYFPGSRPTVVNDLR